MFLLSSSPNVALLPLYLVVLSPISAPTGHVKALQEEHAQTLIREGLLDWISIFS